jgi:nucleoside-diphosphate-sugar epimerase
MRVVVVGGSGNVGTAVLRRLHTETDIDIVGISRRRPPKSEPYDNAVAWHAVDIADPKASEPLRQAMSGADAVIHLAWGFQPTRDPAYLQRVGVEGSARVLEAALGAGVPHLVHQSSVGVYAPKRDDHPVREDYPATSVPASPYSRHKAAAEAHLDDVERANPGAIALARTRPGFVLQADAGAAFTRYGLPSYLPSRLLRHVPVLPIAKRLVIPVVHATDLADAIARIVRRQATGAFNLAADEPLHRDDIAKVLGARPFEVPAPVVRYAIDLTWRLRLQPLDPSWIDLAFAVPLLDTARARTILDWHPAVAADRSLTETIEAMAAGRGIPSPVLRPRSAIGQLRRLVRDGPITTRRLP